jgi:RNA polymerase sigma-70 factor, ECF subfamily
MGPFDARIFIPYHFDLGTALEQQIHASRERTLSNETIIALIRKIEGGDSSALILLYDSTSRLIFGLIMRILGDRTSAEVALLDVYTHLWKHAASYDARMTPLEWMVTIARTSAVARLHWSKRNSRKPESSTGNIDAAMTVAPEQQKLARSSLESLASAQRELLEWAYYGGISCNEMASQIGKPLGAVKSHIRLGLAKLAECIRPISGTK